MKKINLFVFAAHHASNNIAAQRFKGLLKYLDSGKYRVYVFTRTIESARMESTIRGSDIHVIGLPGHCVGSESSARSSLLTLASAFVRNLPFAFAKGVARATRPWFINALGEAERLCRDRLADGERCLTIGTYSPIDALIAAASLGQRLHIPCVQDFRDGLVFDALGKPGYLRNLLRTAIERQVLAKSQLIVSVTQALVDDFARRYPRVPTALLPNGYDPAEFADMDRDNSERAEALIAQHVTPGAMLIGHFGRIGASDGSASQALYGFVERLNELKDVASRIYVLFAGELTPDERAAIERAAFPTSVFKPVDRGLVLQLMKRCDRLLLLMGTRASCAPGKLFEYLAAGIDVLCFSAVRNSASLILEETGSGSTVLLSDTAEALRAALSEPHVAPRDISAYSRKAQADVLDRWLTGLVSA